MVFPSPQSKDGVADVIEKTEGLVKTKMKVKYKDDSEKGSSKRTGTIKDNEISSVNDIEVSGELDEAFDEIMSYKKSFKSLNVESPNNIILYDEYRKKKNW